MGGDEFNSEKKFIERPKIGWFCTYTPEELIFAAGFHPFRIREEISATKFADTYIHHNICPFVRRSLEYGFQNKDPKFLGVVITNSCDAMRCLYHNWKKYLPSTSFIHFLHVPRIRNSLAVEYFTKEIMGLKRALEDYSGRRIEESSLHSALRTYQESRELLKKLYDLRREERIDLDGVTFYRIMKESQEMPKAEFNPSLKNLIEKASENQKREIKKRPRVMIVGSLLRSERVIEIIEGAGAKVVVDDLCFGRRYFEFNVEESDDLLTSLSKGYLSKVPCARMKDSHLRLMESERLVEEYRVEGIIYLTLKFCDNHLYDYPLFRDYFQRKGIPFLQIEDDFKGENVGQLRTRIEAFLEVI